MHMLKVDDVQAICIQGTLYRHVFILMDGNQLEEQTVIHLVLVPCTLMT